MTDRDSLLAEIKKKAVVHGRVVLSSGKEADFYLDLRRITLDGVAAPLVGRVMLDLTADLEFDAVGGLTLGADPVPTLRIECVADTCPLVTVRVPGGDVLQHRDMSRGEEVSYFEPELDVVLSDAGTVRVTENGERRPQGEPGGRESFTTRGPAG